MGAGPRAGVKVRVKGRGHGEGEGEGEGVDRPPGHEGLHSRPTLWQANSCAAAAPCSSTIIPSTRAIVHSRRCERPCMITCAARCTQKPESSHADWRA